MRYSIARYHLCLDDLHFSPNRAELARLFQPKDLWLVLLWALAAAELVTWCVAFPIFLWARLRNVASITGMCTVSGAISFLIAMIAAPFSSTPSSVLVVGLIIAAHGVLVALLFSLLADLPRDASRSMLLQSDVKTSRE